MPYCNLHPGMGAGTLSPSVSRQLNLALWLPFGSRMRYDASVRAELGAVRPWGEGARLSRAFTTRVYARTVLAL